MPWALGQHAAQRPSKQELFLHSSLNEAQENQGTAETPKGHQGQKETAHQTSNYSGQDESFSKGNCGLMSQSPLSSKPQCLFL